MKKKQLATIYETEHGSEKWKIKTSDGIDSKAIVIWIDTFESEEEATTYALRNGCRVEGC